MSSRKDPPSSISLASLGEQQPTNHLMLSLEGQGVKTKGSFPAQGSNL